MRWFRWLSQLFYLLLLLYSQLTSSSSSSFSSPSTLICSQYQSSALLQFKHLFSFVQFASSNCEEVGQHSYPKMENWKEGTDCCSWDGVTCDRVRGDVIGLDLSCSWLNGTIPSNSTLFLLPRLQWLSLAFNYFDFSPIPSGLGRFAGLKHLNLSSSTFFGQVPIDLSHLSQLASLDLSDYDIFSEYNSYVNLEASVMKRLVQNLTKLRELHLDFVNMSSVSLNSLMNLSSSLTFLTLNSCELRGRLPDHIFRLPNLHELSLSENLKLTWSFPRVNWSESLMRLDVSYTIYSGELPKSIGKLKFLRHLILRGCNFNGSIPVWVGNFTQLTVLDLSSNNFGGEIPSSFSKLKALSYLCLERNHLSGALPMWLGNLSQLTYLDLSVNNFSGEMPSSLTNLNVLSTLYLGWNHLCGTLPMWLGNLTRVTRFSLRNNNFMGQIPSSLSNLRDLTYASLGYNNFEGMDPDFLTNLTKLTSIYLSFNQLTGQFDKYQFIKSLNILALDNNKLYGSIPKSISNLVNLTYLDISSNDLTGIVDLDMFKNLKKLEIIDFHANLLHGKLPILPSFVRFFFISNNSFSGEIPSTICNLTSLQLLDISYNSLSGKILPCLGNFSYLEVMDLRMNNFHGTMPETFSKGNWLTTLAFNGNQLEGLLPKSLVNCKYLEVLDIGNNKINDSFPYWLEALPELQVLILTSNRFNGPIDNLKTKSSFPMLRIIDLSHNEFTGILPTKFFEGLIAINSINEGDISSDTELMYMQQSYYLDSIEVVIKGHELFLEKILTIFTTLDLSSNKFHGKIPEVLGTLKFLRALNLSHNSLTGHIPSSLANLSALESLDLSSNKLTGEIPMQLTSLTFLAVLDLSQNQLVGPIPQGKQFDTFQNDSYGENLGLCGLPLSKKCSTDASPLPSPSIFQEDNDSMFESGFGWKAVLMGYGCGFGFGLAVGYVFWFKTEKPQWLVRFFDGGNGKTGWLNNQRPRRRRS